MTHRFPVKEIAAQAGMSTATIDRVLNGRAHVSPQTRKRVARAIEELERQEDQLSARGRRVFFDVVVEAPRRFTEKLAKATDDVLATLPAVIRPRFQMQETMSVQDCLATLKRIGKRGSNGVCLKARNLPQIVDAVDELVARGIPVTTLVTDLPGSQRSAYAGLDNAAAGRTAAFLIDRFSAGHAGTVLCTQSGPDFQGEAARFLGFKEFLTAKRPELHIIDARGGSGLNSPTARLVEDAVAHEGELLGVYSMGGGNRAIVTALAHRNLIPACFVAHDLDADNRDLLQAGHLTAVLEHDLRIDIRNAFLHLLDAAGVARLAHAPAPNTIQIITPENLTN
jgi:LacI family transcriptional regulator